MARKTPGHSKITRPDVSGIAPRMRLVALLENVKQPVSWISGPGGSGKTTLVASYLDVCKLPFLWYQMDEGDTDPATFFHYMGIAAKMAAYGRTPSLPPMMPEYLQHGIPSFAKKFFESLYKSLVSSSSENKGSRHQSRPFCIVLDNYQDVSPDAGIHEIIASGLALVPDRIKVLILSRDKPPSFFVQTEIDRNIRFIGWDDIRFTLDESRAIISPEMQRGIIDRALKEIHEKAQGWAAGMILMLEKTRLEDSGIESMANQSSEKIFDFFAGEIFDRTEREIQDFLLKTAFLPGISIQMADRITGQNSAERILSALNSHHFFTEKLSCTEHGYKYHPLFRTFLLNRSQSEFTADELSSIKKEAALLLEESDQHEDAARLFSDAGDWDNLSRMIIHHAREFIVQGRNKIIEEWIACVPAEMADENPWLVYWNGMSSFPYNIPRTRNYLEKAFESFRELGDTAGIYLSWAGIVDSFAFELDGWKRLDRYIEILDELLKEHPSLPSADIDLMVSSRMLVSLTLRKTDHPELVNEWYEKVSSLLHKQPSTDIQMDTFFCMSLYYLWTGEYNKNAILLERAEAEIRHHEPSPFSIIRIKLMKGVHCWITARYDSAIKNLSDGLDISEKSGAHVFDSLLWSFTAAAEMASGRMERAGGALKNQLASLLDMTKNLDIFFYYINAAWYAILNNRPSLAAENMDTISARVAKMGTPYCTALWNIGMSQVAFLQGRTKDAKNHVQISHNISTGMKSNVMEWYSLLLKAYFFLKEGNERQGLLSLRQGLSIGRKYGYVHLEFYQPSVMQFLYAKAVEKGIEKEYVTKSIEKLGLTPPDSEFYLEEWPWPLKIFTLGRFEIIKNGKTLGFQGKEPQKPLEMLKAIIAFGGRNVPHEQIADALWPDADGDLALKSLETTLGRLRRIPGLDHLVRYSNDQISLDPGCWVDSLVLGHIYSKIRKLQPEQTARLCDKAADLYQGHFLPSDTGLHWAVSRREMLKSSQLRIIISAGHNCEQAGKLENAADFYLRGLDTDDLAEEFYQRLMICYQKLGRQADAARIYKRCHNVLRDNLGLAPSPETSAIFSSILQKN